MQTFQDLDIKPLALYVNHNDVFIILKLALAFVIFVLTLIISKRSYINMY